MTLLFSGDGLRSIYEAYRPAFPAAACGGNGTCGKCKVHVAADDPTALPLPDAEEARLLSPEEITAGFRLACRCRPVGDCAVSLPGEASVFQAVSAYRVPSWRSAGLFLPGERFGIAVDIGTTTIAMELVDRSDVKILARETFLNGQRRFGADVLSRIRAATEGSADELRATIRSDLRAGFARLMSDAPSVDPARVDAVVIAANVTMVHLLLGLDCDGLGRAPFTPIALSFPEMRIGEIIDEPERLGLLARCSVCIIPAIGTFVGGDIVSGLAALDLPDAAVTAPVLFIDLGTNAEMALVASGRLWCSSAASGPAFEGASISCGTGSVPGAVSSVYLEGNHFGYALIGEDDGTGKVRAAARRPSPVGVCGSGLVDFVACALDAGLIRRDGSLVPACADSGILLDASGTIRLLASDIREFQLAKAAIRAGVSTLLSAAGLSVGAVARVYIAGGFGLYLKEASAIRTGLFPEEFSGTLEPVGNTALAGATRYLADPAMLERFDAVIRGATAFELANDPAFSARFIDSMEFD